MNTGYSAREDRRLLENNALRRAVTVVRRALPFAAPGKLPRGWAAPSLPAPLSWDVVYEADEIGAVLVEEPGRDLVMRARGREAQSFLRPNWRMPRRHLEVVLKRAPLLALLGDVAVEELAAEASWRTVASGTPLFTEGERARTLQLITAGRVAIDAFGPSGWRPLGMRKPYELVGLCSGAPLGRRQARIRAHGVVSFLELDAERFARRLANSPAAQQLAAAMNHDRMLERLLAISPFADAVGPVQRGIMVKRFQSTSIKKDERLVAPGELRHGLWLVKQGRIALWRRVSFGYKSIGLIEAGNYFGCVSALRGQPVDAVAIALEPTQVVGLPHMAIHETLQLHPTARGIPALLAAEQRLLDGHFYTGRCVI